jgi:hypothetical protein
MGFNPLEWWRKWHPDKANGRGREKSSGGNAGTGRAANQATNPNNVKKSVVPKNRRGFDGRV